MSDFINRVKESVLERVRAMPYYDDRNANTLDFCQIFKGGDQPCIIAEIKFSTPSRGKLYLGKLDAVEIARGYLSNGASAISVVAEPQYFDGNIEYIKEIRKTFPKAHILLKDFILSEKQISQGLAYGASAVLLIAAFLNKTKLKRLYEYAVNLGLTPIIEIHNKRELDVALSFNPRVIGINNRNLKSLKINLETSRSLIKYVPNEIHVLCESGITSKEECSEMEGLGFNGFLIGSHFMTQESPFDALKIMLRGIKDES